jgi:Zn-dependent protease with chaperone function
VGFITTPELRPILIALPLLPWLSRWAEKRCDRVAADLGYGRDLLDLFQWWQDSGFEEPRPAGVVRQVFSSHPTVANRIHALRTYLTENGLT